jgi:hypothetical protein
MSKRSKVANVAGFGRLAKSPCFLEGAQAIKFRSRLRIFEKAMQVIPPLAFTSPFEGAHGPSAHLRSSS